MTKPHHKLGLSTTRGMTLIEIMITVTIIAMVSAGVAFAAWQSKQDADLSITKTALRTVRGAVQTYFATESTECPSMNELLRSGTLDEGQNHLDAWGGDFKIECPEGRIIVSSAGPDRKPGTEDDLVIPPRREN